MRNLEVCPLKIEVKGRICDPEPSIQLIQECGNAPYVYLRLYIQATYINVKALKCKPSANCACAVPLIFGGTISIIITLWSDTGQLDSLREIHRASGPARGSSGSIRVVQARLALRPCWNAKAIQRKSDPTRPFCIAARVVIERRALITSQLAACAYIAAH